MHDQTKDLIALSSHDAFARFIEGIHFARESVIEDMAGAKTEELQQLSGRVIAYNEILRMCNWDDLRMRHRENLNTWLCYNLNIVLADVKRAEI